MAQLYKMTLYVRDCAACWNAEMEANDEQRRHC